MRERDWTGLRGAALACLLFGTLACGGLSALLPEPRVTFLNPSDASVRFTAAGRTFDVEPGGILEIGLPYDGVWDVAVDGAVIGRVDLARGPHWRDLKAFDLTASGCWVLVDGSAAYFADHLGIRNLPPPPHVARTWRGVHQVEHGVGGVENCQTDLCKMWGTGGIYVMPGEPWPRPKGRNPNPTVRRLVQLACSELDEPGWEERVVLAEVSALTAMALDVDP